MEDNILNNVTAKVSEPFDASPCLKQIESVAELEWAFQNEIVLIGDLDQRTLGSPRGDGEQNEIMKMVNSPLCEPAAVEQFLKMCYRCSPPSTEILIHV